MAYQQGADEVWTTFPQVQTNVIDGCLYIASPYCCQPTWFKTSDRADKVGEQQLIHYGRADDVVKIEEKRVALSDIENRLRAHADVIDAKVILIEKKRLALAAVVVLSTAAQINRQAAPNAYTQSLKKYLSDYFEAVTLPKLFRFVDKIPENEQGKVLKSALIKLFDK